MQIFKEINLIINENIIKSNKPEEEKNSESLEIFEKDNIYNENINDIIKLIEGIALKKY